MYGHMIWGGAPLPCFFLFHLFLYLIILLKPSLSFYIQAQNLGTVQKRIANSNETTRENYYPHGAQSAPTYFPQNPPIFFWHSPKIERKINKCIIYGRDLTTFAFFPSLLLFLSSFPPFIFLFCISFLKV